MKHVVHTIREILNIKVVIYLDDILILHQDQRLPGTSRKRSNSFSSMVRMEFGEDGGYAHQREKKENKRRIKENEKKLLQSPNYLLFFFFHFFFLQIKSYLH
jgi:hypothetical protein